MIRQTRERLLLEVVRDVAGILNRGGVSVEESLLEARLRLGAEVKLLEGCEAGKS